MAILDAYFNTGGVNCLQVLPTTPVKLTAKVDGLTGQNVNVKAGIKVIHDGSTQEFEFYTPSKPLTSGTVTFETDTIYLAAPQTNLHIVWVTVYNADTGATIQAGAPPGTSPNGCASVNVISQQPAGAGTLYITSMPVGADVIVDGQPQNSKTPINITNLSSGNHTYRLVLSGYKDASGTFSIESGKTTTVSVPLTKAEEKGIGAGTILGISLLGLGILGVAIAATRKGG